MDHIDWPDGTGRTYRYWFVSDPTGGLKREPGNYMFVKQLPNGNWLPVYIGVADDLNDRISTQERAAEARKLGATKIMAHTLQDRAARLAEEKALIGHWNPEMNQQHRSAATRLTGQVY